LAARAGGGPGMLPASVDGEDGLGMEKRLATILRCAERGVTEVWRLGREDLAGPGASIHEAGRAVVEQQQADLGARGQDKIVELSA
jgi:hypothetical protein